MTDVKENRIKNEWIREELNCYALTQTMEMRRAKWLEKIANMSPSRNPRKLFMSWVRAPRPTGRPKQTIRRGYADTIENSLGYKNCSYKFWMSDAKNPTEWKTRVETNLSLNDGTYKNTNRRGQTCRIEIK